MRWKAMVGRSLPGERRDSSFLITFLVLLISHSLLMALQRLYPFTDVPNHLAVATIYRFYGEPTNQFDRFFTVSHTLSPYSFHRLFCTLHVFPSVEFANRAYHVLCVLLLPICMLLLIRRLGGNPWFALPSFLLLYNYSMRWGFVGFSMANPALLLIVFFSVGREKTLLSRLALMFLLTWIFFLHILAASFGLMLFCALSFYRNRRALRGILKDAISAVPLLVLLIISSWWRPTHRLADPALLFSLLYYYRNEFLPTFALRFKEILILDNEYRYLGVIGTILSLSFFLPFAVPFTMPVVTIMMRGRRTLQQIQKEQVASALILVACALSCYLLLPGRVPGIGFWYAYQRFSVWVLLGSALLGSLLCSPERLRVGRWAITLLCFLHLAVWSEYFLDFQKENKGFTPDFLPSSENGKVLAGLVYAYEFRGAPVYIHFPSYYIVWKQGIAVTKIVDYASATYLGSTSSVGRKVSIETLPPYEEWIGFKGGYDGRYEHVDYLLVRGRVPPEAQLHLRSFQPFKSAGEWVLYGRTADD